MNCESSAQAAMNLICLSVTRGSAYFIVRMRPSSLSDPFRGLDLARPAYLPSLFNNSIEEINERDITDRYLTYDTKRAAPTNDN